MVTLSTTMLHLLTTIILLSIQSNNSFEIPNTPKFATRRIHTCKDTTSSTTAKKATLFQSPKRNNDSNSAVAIFPIYSRRNSYSDEEEDDNEYEYATTRKSRYRRRYRDDYEEGEENDDFLNEFDDDDDDDDTEEEYTIPNPELDYLDPDRSTERLGELFADKLFWRDLSIFILVIFIWQQFFIPQNWLYELKHASNLSGPLRIIP